jgi:hypothetical protein
LEGIELSASCIVPMGQTQPQKKRLENKTIKRKSDKSKKGKVPSTIKKKIYSPNPAPFDKGLFGDANIGKIFMKFSKPFKLIKNINSRIT